MLIFDTNAKFYIASKCNKLHFEFDLSPLGHIVYLVVQVNYRCYF